MIKEIVSKMEIFTNEFLNFFEKQKLLPVTCRFKTDYIFPEKNETKNFETITDVKIKDFAEGIIKISGELSIFTDGSSSKEGIGAGVFCPEMDIQESFKLPRFCNITIAETFAVMKAAEILMNRKISDRQISIYTDCKQTINHVSGTIMYSNIDMKCKQTLNALGENNTLRLVYIPSHRQGNIEGFKGNNKADDLAKIGARKEGPDEDVGIQHNIKVGDHIYCEQCRFCGLNNLRNGNKRSITDNNTTLHLFKCSGLIEIRTEIFNAEEIFRKLEDIDPEKLIELENVKEKFDEFVDRIFRIFF